MTTFDAVDPTDVAWSLSDPSSIVGTTWASDAAGYKLILAANAGTALWRQAIPSGLDIDTPWDILARLDISGVSTAGFQYMDLGIGIEWTDGQFTLIGNTMFTASPALHAAAIWNGSAPTLGSYEQVPSYPGIYGKIHYRGLYRQIRGQATVLTGADLVQGTRAVLTNGLTTNAPAYWVIMVRNRSATALQFIADIGVKFTSLGGWSP